MACRLRSTIPMITLAACAATAFAGAGRAATDCGEPKPFLETAQDEIRTRAERCGWRDDSLGTDSVRDMTLAQAELPHQKMNLTMEQHHVIKEIVLKDLKPSKTPGNVEVSIGDPVPAGVNVQPFPRAVSAKVPQVQSHGFFVTGERVIIVNPKDNRVADIID
jgi:hypothetical protein